MARDLTEIVKREHWLETEYLTTVFVVVPKYLSKDWENCYETLTEYVLPRSSKSISEDNEYSLFSVSLFKKKVDDFRLAAREKKFTVRDFQFNEGALSQGIEEKKKLQSAREQQKNKLVLWCKTNFSEAFIAWIHLKSIRLFVESILRYGLPANYQAALTLPQKKDDKRVRTALADLFRHLGSKHLEADAEGESETFYPYVSLNLNLEMKNVM